MTAEMIEKFVAPRINDEETVKIHFKDRQHVTGLFIQTNDYSEMKAKNFWRVVSEDRVEAWKQTRNVHLSRLFNGASFTRLLNSES